MLEQALDGTILVNEGGRQQRITKRQAMFKMLVARAVSGDPRAMSKVLTLMDEHGLMKNDIPRCIEVRFVSPGEVRRD